MSLMKTRKSYGDGIESSGVRTTQDSSAKLLSGSIFDSPDFKLQLAPQNSE